MLGDTSDDPQFIRGVIGGGYVFVAPVFEPHKTTSPVRSLEDVGLRIALAATAAAAVGIAVLTTAVGSTAAAFGLFCVLLVAGYHRLTDCVFTRGLASLLLYAGMAYVPSAWTLSQLSGEVINFDTLPPSPLYALVTGMKYLPLFFLVLACWTASATRDRWIDWMLMSRVTFWTTAALLMLMTAAALWAYSGEGRILQTGVPGSGVLAISYGAIAVINVGFAWFGIELLNDRVNGGSQRLLSACAVAFLAAVTPAVAIGTAHNEISRYHLDIRRPVAYRAGNPDAALSWSEAARGARADVGADLRSLLRSEEFRRALRDERFYRREFDEQFQLGHRAVTFGYRTGGQEAGRAAFRLVRLPVDLALDLGLAATE